MRKLPKKQLSPGSLDGTTLLIGLFSPDPDTLFHQAVSAGAHVVDAMETYEYGYRQGTVADPFGHQWLIQKKIPS
jgi:PhnB protein